MSTESDRRCIFQVIEKQPTGVAVTVGKVTATLVSCSKSKVVVATLQAPSVTTGVYVEQSLPKTDTPQRFLISEAPLFKVNYSLIDCPPVDVHVE